MLPAGLVHTFYTERVLFRGEKVQKVCGKVGVSESIDFIYNV